MFFGNSQPQFGHGRRSGSSGLLWRCAGLLGLLAPGTPWRLRQPAATPPRTAPAPT